MSTQIENVLLITIDSLRTDFFLTDSESREDTTFTSLSNKGTAFMNAYATGPGTTPSFPALLTGTLPLSYDGLGPLNDRRPRLASHLKAHGIATGGFHSNPFLSTYFNYDVGFDRFEDYQNPLMGVATKLFPRGIEVSDSPLSTIDEVLNLTGLLKGAYQRVKGKPRPYVSAGVITDDTIDWLRDTEGPFFAWAHYMDVHHPCFPPAEYCSRFDVTDVTMESVSEMYTALINHPDTLSESDLDQLKRLYDAAVAYTDDQVGRLVEELARQNRDETTMVIVTSDHGELFGEHGEFAKPERLYDELLRVPLCVVNGPDSIGPAADNLVSLLDVPPLILEALDVPDVEEFTGRVPGEDPPRTHIKAEHEVDGDIVVGARSEDFLYEVDEIRGETRLFDARSGRLDRVPLEELPEDSRNLPRAVEKRLSELDVETHHAYESVPDDVESRLDELGYL